MRSALTLSLTLSLVLFGCPPASSQPDAGRGEEDVGMDAGIPDAGRPPRDAGVPDAGFTTAPLAQWCQLRALAECSRDVRCGRLAPAQVPGCVLTRTTLPQCDALALTRGVQEGRSRYAEAEALDCLNPLGFGSCEETPPACARVFTGLAPPDAGCLLSSDCNADGFCDVYDGRCPHRCRGWTPLGAPCDGFFSRCHPELGSCDTTDGGLAVCGPRKQEGDPCSRYDACGDALACVSSVCVKRQAGPGEPCGVTSGFPFCGAEFFCRQRVDDQGVAQPGTCQRRAGLGDACVSGSCLPSLRCSGFLVTGTCELKASLGAPCVNYDDCQDTLFCSGKTLRCEGLPDAGGDCSADRTSYRCAPGNACAYSATGDDRCVAWKAVGAPCGSAGECLSNDCDYATLPDGGFGGTCIESCSQRADGGL